jgi:phenylacetate-CoA ligase
MHDVFDQIRSGVSGVVWPALPDADGRRLLALLYQLDHTQWWSAAELQRHQLRQLELLLRHASATVPYYRDRWAGIYDPAQPITPERYVRLPVLTRAALRDHFETLRCGAVPAEHGPVFETRTSGSTGRPVRTLKTPLVELLWQAFVLREHRWHQRDLRGKLAAIRHGVPEGDATGWGPATDAVFVTGPSATLSVRHEVDAQLEWLQRQQPDYLLSYPSNLTELARRSLALGIRLSRLREVRTFGEALPSGLRALCRQAWNVPVVDAYSSQETGYMALQCPVSEQYHVQSEGVLVEILDESGQACAPGETGRVIVTDLHNHAMPLVRYEIGDYAEAGEPCPCGRGLPVLRRISGRTRNMLVLANGARYWPAFGSTGLAELAPILQQQVVQTGFTEIEVRLVTARPLTAAEEGRLSAHIRSRLPAPFEIRFGYRDAIERSASGKYEDFISEVA